MAYLRLRVAVVEKVGLRRLEPQRHAPAVGAVPGGRGHRRRRRARVASAVLPLQGRGLVQWLGLGLGQLLV